MSLISPRGRENPLSVKSSLYDSCRSVSILGKVVLSRTMDTFFSVKGLGMSILNVLGFVTWATSTNVHMKRALFPNTFVLLNYDLSHVCPVPSPLSHLHTMHPKVLRALIQGRLGHAYETDPTSKDCLLPIYDCNGVYAVVKPWREVQDIVEDSTDPIVFKVILKQLENTGEATKEDYAQEFSGIPTSMVGRVIESEHGILETAALIGNEMEEEAEVDVGVVETDQEQSRASEVCSSTSEGSTPKRPTIKLRLKTRPSADDDMTGVNITSNPDSVTTLPKDDKASRRATNATSRQQAILMAKTNERRIKEIWDLKFSHQNLNPQ